MGATGPPDRDPDEVRRVAQEILDGPGFERESEPLVQQVLSWIGDRLSDLFGGGAGDPVVGAGGGTRGSLVGWIVLAVVLVVLGLVLWRATKGLTLRRAARTQPDVVEDEVTAADEWRLLAAAAEARGDLREAARCLYRALVVDLSDRGAISEVPARTTGEHRHDVQTHAPDRALAFAAVATTFEDIYYGGRPVDPTDLEVFRAGAPPVPAGAAAGGEG